MARKGGLGRGLDALIPGSESLVAAGMTTVPIDAISPNPRQPRSRFDEEEMEELAASIRERGMIQPLIVSHANEVDRYILIAGQRRLVAARMAGLTRVPVIIREVTDQERLELALIENVQRADLSPLETAEAYRQLAEDFNLSHEQIAQRVAKSRAAVTNSLRLLKLEDSVREALADGRISEGHARALLGLRTPQAQSNALQTILIHDLNVRQTEALVRRLNGERPAQRRKASPPPEIIALAERLQTSLGTRVSLHHRRKGGTITIHYYSEEELNALVEKLLGNDEPAL